MQGDKPVKLCALSFASNKGKSARQTDYTSIVIWSLIFARRKRHEYTHGQGSDVGQSRFNSTGRFFVGMGLCKIRNMRFYSIRNEYIRGKCQGASNMIR